MRKLSAKLGPVPGGIFIVTVLLTVPLSRMYLSTDSISERLALSISVTLIGLALSAVTVYFGRSASGRYQTILGVVGGVCGAITGFGTLGMLAAVLWVLLTGDWASAGF